MPIAFQGHNHCYEHSLVNDVHYIVTGGGGAPLYTSWGQPQSWTVYREATFEFVLVSVNGDTLSCKVIEPGGTVIDSLVDTTPAGAIREGNAVPVSPDLGLTATPNPSARQTRITFTMPEPGPATLTLHDTAGKLRASIVDGVLGAGEHDVTWASEGLPSGTYLLVLKMPRGTSSVRLVIQR